MSTAATPSPVRHALWLRLTHWVATIAFGVLVYTGTVILMSHPRLYWGEVGNELTPALLELPVSRNHRHGGWSSRVPLTDDPNGPVSAVRTFAIFNENGWGRSLHFLAGWVLVGAGLVYLLAGNGTRHFRRHLVPRAHELTRANVTREIADHLRLRIPPPSGGPNYNLLQKLSYLLIGVVVLPFVLLTGLAMSPTMVAGYPWLTGMFGGAQSARTVHFVLTVVLLLFLVEHLAMVAKSGWARHLRAMTLGA